MGNTSTFEDMVKPVKFLLPILLTDLLLLSGDFTIAFAGSQTLDNQHVGFALIETSRHSERWSPGASIKPISGWFWYPIKPTSKETTTYGDYLNFLSPGKSPDEQLATFQRIINGFREDKISTHVLTTYLSQDSPAYHAEEVPSGQSPLVVLSGAHPIYFIELAEALTQSGYCVLSVPRTGQKQGERLPYSALGVKEYQTDLRAMLDHINQLSYVNVEELAFVSWSFEGIATLHVASSMRTKCFISLDAAIGYDYGLPLVKESVFDRKVSFPIIHYTGTSISHGKQLDLLEKHADQVRLIGDFNFSHGDFTSLSSLTAYRLINGETNVQYELLIDDVLTRLRSAFDR